MQGVAGTNATLALSRGTRIGGAAFAALALVALVGWGARSNVAGGQTDVASAPGGNRVERGTLVQTVVATGTTEPVSRVEVKSQVSGLIRRVLVEKGDRVKPGQPLFELDRDRLEARVSGLEAALAMRRAEAAHDLVGRASIGLEEKRRDFERSRELARHGVVSPSELERAERAVRLAQVDLTDARANADARRAAVLEAEWALRQAQKDLEESVIRAELDAIVVDRRVDLGSVVADITSSGGTVLAVLADDTRVRLVAEVDENEIAAVRVGQSAQVTLDAYPGEAFAGRVTRVAAAGTVETNVSNFEIELELPADPRIRLGMSADARVAVREWKDALLVPVAAIAREASGPVVRVIDASAPGGARAVAIRELYSDGFQSVVGDELRAGERLLVRGEADPG
jgi:HlyD family secretion protein